MRRERRGHERFDPRAGRSVRVSPHTYEAPAAAPAHMATAQTVRAAAAQSTSLDPVEVAEKTADAAAAARLVSVAAGMAASNSIGLTESWQQAAGAAAGLGALSAGRRISGWWSKRRARSRMERWHGIEGHSRQLSRREVDRLIAEGGYSARLHASEHESLTDAQVEALYEESEGEMRVALASNCSVPPGWRRRFRHSDDPPTRVGWALRSDLDEGERSELLSDPVVDARAAFASRVDLVEAEAEVLASDSAAAVRGAVARSGRLSDAGLKRLSKDKDPMVSRSAVVALARSEDPS